MLLFPFLALKFNNNIVHVKVSHGIFEYLPVPTGCSLQIQPLVGSKELRPGAGED